MIKDFQHLKKIENQYKKNTPPDLFRNLKIYEALYEEARALGVFPLKDPLKGLEIRISLTKAVNVSVPEV